MVVAAFLCGPNAVWIEAKGSPWHGHLARGEFHGRPGNAGQATRATRLPVPRATRQRRVGSPCHVIATHASSHGLTDAAVGGKMSVAPAIDHQRRTLTSFAILFCTMSILVFNAGSTSLKFGLFTDPACALLVSGALDWAGGDRHCAVLTLRSAEEMRAQNCTVDVPDDPAAVQCALQALAEALPGGAQLWRRSRS